MEETLQEIWTQRIAAYQAASGQTMKAWCTEQDLTLHQLKYWLYKAQRQHNPVATSATFRAVSITALEPETEPLWVQVGSARITLISRFLR
ncbi:IS66 family insertion sequence element accessory protein TnpA [Paenibacillus alginolyticus]|nr:IS66 family insertion sequence element accessory protein TnpB [Paenibacillus alginolyticus]MEC0146533.1 IS66 family insertion sequence element accessory protein TnpB [Paenibacillus alginolyticus]